MVDEYEPEWVTVNVMDAKTGDILASSASPSFDPNKLNLVNYYILMSTNPSI